MAQDKPPAAEGSEEKQQPKKSKKWLFLPLSYLLLLAAIGLLLWLWLTCRQHQQDLEQKNKDLQSQIDQLNKTAPSATPTPTPQNTCPDVTDTLRANIKDAVTSRNYAALQGSMTDPITVVYAATEFGGAKTPAEAVSAMDYLNNGTAPWDFNLPAATISAYKAGDYKQYFPDGAYVGKSSDGVVVSFGFNCGKINLIFISLQDLL